MMMLAIETATLDVGVAIGDGTNVLATLVASTGRRHVETLHPAIEAVCRAADVSLHSVEAIAIDVGPGRFTGIRVGVSAAKGLAFALEVPLVACLSTEVLGRAARGDDVVPIIDMRRGECAWRPPGSGDDADELCLGTPETLAEALAHAARPLRVVGDGALRYREELAVLLRQLGAAPVETIEIGAPTPAALLGCATARLRSGESGVDSASLAPVYLRPPDAKINWTSRITAGAPTAGS